MIIEMYWVDLPDGSSDIQVFYGVNFMDINHQLELKHSYTMIYCSSDNNDYFRFGPIPI